MKSQTSDQSQKYDKIIYQRRSKRGWSIVIMPDNIRLDNFHGFTHIHMGGIKNHSPIKYDEFNKVKEIVIVHIERNKGINKKELLVELIK